MQKLNDPYRTTENVSEMNVTPQVGDLAPRFYGVTTKGDINFPDDYIGKWVILFSHAYDFSPVSTTEYMQLASIYKKIVNCNAEVIGISMDSIYTHIAWLRRIYDLSWKGIKFADISFPIIEDTSMEISKKYGLVRQKDRERIHVGSVYIIDHNSVIRAILQYPDEVGRNIDEILRILTALQKVDNEQVSIPANWVNGEDVILKTPSSLISAKERINIHEKDQYILDWFLCFKQEVKKEN